MGQSIKRGRLRKVKGGGSGGAGGKQERTVRTHAEAKPVFFCSVFPFCGFSLLLFLSSLLVLFLPHFPKAGCCPHKTLTMLSFNIIPVSTSNPIQYYIWQGKLPTQTHGFVIVRRHKEEISCLNESMCIQKTYLVLFLI